MKKILLIAACLVVATAAQAQYYKANIFGVRGGLNAAMLTTNLGDGLYANRQAKLGWHFGFSDQILLNRRIPFYLETGLYLSNKGGGYKHSVTVAGVVTSGSVALGATYLQIPLKINYHIDAGSFSIEPYVGLHYNIGLWGREVVKMQVNDPADSANNRKSKEVFDIYRDGGFRRSDFGVTLGVGGAWSDMYFGLGWEAGFLNLAKAEGGKAYNSSVFQILLGYNF